jgi:prepilin signal peptidase PulO-like enzyme (type II secretory pathway)
MILLFAFILGSCCGSFFSLIGERAPAGQSIITPASHCSHCHTTLRWRDLIPLGAVFTKFRCRHCQQAFSPLSTLWEAITAVLFVWLVGTLPHHPQATFYGLWLVLSLVLAIMDSYHKEILLNFFVASSVILLVAALWSQLTLYWFHPVFFMAFFILLARLMKDSFGLGDQLLLSFWSLFLPVTVCCQLILVACLLGLLLFGVAKLCQRPLTTLPFIPCLFLALWLILAVTL